MNEQVAEEFNRSKKLIEAQVAILEAAKKAIAKISKEFVDFGYDEDPDGEFKKAIGQIDVVIGVTGATVEMASEVLSEMEVA